jgi:hypothetical protein
VTGLALPRFGGELSTMLGPAVDAVRRRQWRRFSLGAAAMLAVAALALAFRTRWGHGFIESYAITRPGNGWVMIAIRLPLSMFAPAAMLPFWFAMFQVGVVYGLGQVLLGWRRTALVAAGGHALATFSSHLWIMIGRPVGVGHRFDQFGDAGPSVAVVTVIAYLAVAQGAAWLAGLLIAYDALEIGVFNGLSQREHLLGVLFGAATAVVARWLAKRRPGAPPPVPGRTPAGGALPVVLAAEHPPRRSVPPGGGDLPLVDLPLVDLPLVDLGLVDLGGRDRAQQFRAGAVEGDEQRSGQ